MHEQLQIAIQIWSNIDQESMAGSYSGRKSKFDWSVLVLIRGSSLLMAAWSGHMVFCKLAAYYLRSRHRARTSRYLQEGCRCRSTFGVPFCHVSLECGFFRLPVYYLRGPTSVLSGMFFYSMGCLLVGATIAYFIINRKSPEERENEEYLKELKKKL